MRKKGNGMISKYTSLIVLSLFMTISIVSASGLNILSISGDKQGTVGNTSTIYVDVSGADAVGSLQFDILYNPSIISANSVIAGSLATGSMFVSNMDNKIGKVTIGLISTEGMTGNGQLAKISYNIVKSGVSKLEISGESATDISSNSIIIGSITGSSFSAVAKPIPPPSDKIAPTTTQSGVSEGATYNSNVTISLVAKDDVGGSGVKNTVYTINGGTVVTYVSPFVVSNIGKNAVTYNSVDNSGNVEKSKKINFTINKVIVSDILTYYRGLGKVPSTVETTDLLKAADDWRYTIIPQGFSVSITTTQLLILADEWRTT